MLINLIGTIIVGAHDDADSQQHPDTSQRNAVKPIDSIGNLNRSGNADEVSIPLWCDLVEGNGQYHGWANAGLELSDGTDEGARQQA